MASVADECTPLLLPGGPTGPPPQTSRIDEEAVRSVAASDEDGKVSENHQAGFSVIATLLLGVFVGNADGTLVISQTGSISSEFNNLSSAEWLVTCYFLASCAAQTVIGKLSDIYGRKPMLLISYVFFIAGNFLSGAGTEMWQVLLGRVIAGIGGGASMSLVSVLIADLVPLRSVAAWRSYVNVAATTGRSCGGPVGGVLTDTVGWRWSFYGQCPLTVIALVLVALRLPSAQRNQAGTASSQQKPESQADKLRRIDFLGAATLVGATLTFLLGLEFASKSSSWLSTRNILVLVGSLVFAVTFVLIEKRVAKEPIFPIRLMLNRDVITSNLVGLLQMIAQVELMVGVPLYFQIAMGASASDAGTRLVPAVVGNATGGLICGLMINRTGRYKLLTIGGLAFSCLGYALIVARWHGQVSWAESAYILPGGFGMGVVQSTTFIALTAGISREDFAVAGSGLYQSMGIGGSIGSCINMVILQAALRPLLRSSLEAIKGKEEIIQRAIEDIYYVQSLRGPVRELVVTSYIEALTWTHGKLFLYPALGNVTLTRPVSSLAFSFLALITALFMKERPI